MADFRIDIEWEESPHARAPELSATWARLEIWAAGAPVTKVEVHRARSVRDGIYVPLYPIAEWMVTNWWFLWHEWRTDHPEMRHNLLAAREGFSLPDLTFLPTETRMQLIWRPRPAGEFGRVSFLGGGSQILRKEMVGHEARSFIEAVVQRLEDKGIATSFLKDEWQAILDLEKDPAQRSFCERAARLGLDPFAVEGSAAEELEELDALVAQTVIDDFCDAIAVDQIRPGAKVVRDFVASAEGPATVHGNWLELKNELQISNGMAPWQYGYQQAQQLRSHLGIRGPIEGDLDWLLREELGSFEVQPFQGPHGIEAITAPIQTHAPRFGIRQRELREESRRFVFCRALSDFLTLSEPAIVTRTQTEHQQRNRAFAAEFLAPAASLRERITTDQISEEDLEDLAQQFSVSGLSFAIRFRITNWRRLSRKLLWPGVDSSRLL